MTAVLDVADLNVVYRTGTQEVFAVSDASFEVDEHDVWGVIGETGCGKSSLARAIVRLLPANGAVTSGSVHLSGVDVLGARPAELRRLRASKLAFIPQNSVGALNPVTRIGDQFRHVIRLNDPKASRAVCRARAAEILRRAGITDAERVLDGYPFHLSGGMAQRVTICLTMIRNPALVVADEPTSGLDLTVLRQVLDLLAEMREETGSAMIMVTHQVEVVAQYCRSVKVMYGGRIIESGPVADVLTKPLHPYTRLLIGSVPERGKHLSTIPGTVRPLTAAPTSCVFHARCPFISDPRCALELPPRRWATPDHWVESFCSSDASATELQEVGGNVGRH